MESCFHSTALFPNVIPEWKENIQVIKKVSVAPQSRSSTGVHSTWQMCSRNISSVRFIPFLSIVFLFQVSFLSLFLFTVRGKTFHVSFFLLFETQGGSRRTGQNEGIPRYSEFFGTGWAFVCLSLHNSVPWLKFKMHCSTRELLSHVDTSGETFRAHDSSLS